MKELYLKSHTRLDNSGLKVEGKAIGTVPEQAEDVLRATYKALELSYPKFFKMDTMGKLGILGTEPFFADGSLKETYASDEIAVILANRSSSMESDIQHQQNFMAGKASPAVFVYTLPNIVIGEICIRHQLLSESNFYIFEAFDPSELLMQAQVLVEQTNCKACILGWVESMDENFEAIFYLLEEGGTQKAEPKLLADLKNMNPA